jgi:hypothetical protein
MSQLKPNEWTVLTDSRAAEALTGATNSPGVIFPMGTNQVPPAIQQMPGLSSYFVSRYVTAVNAGHGVTAGGEMLVARADEGLTKNYNYVSAPTLAGRLSSPGRLRDSATTCRQARKLPSIHCSASRHSGRAPNVRQRSEWDKVPLEATAAGH